MQILIGTKNPHKRQKLSWVVKEYCEPVIKDDLLEVEETAHSFIETAQEKVKAYSKQFNCFAISTDAGAVIPALNKAEWEPLRTKRFGTTDQERIYKLLEMMKDKTNRTIEWHEAIAVAYNGEVLFSVLERAMDAVMDKEFNQNFYREGIWLCSISSFPQFGGKNYFELDNTQQQLTEDSWGKLRSDFNHLIQNKIPTQSI